MIAAPATTAVPTTLRTTTTTTPDPTALAIPPEPVEVPTEGFQTYTTRHNGFTRVRHVSDLRVASEPVENDAATLAAARATGLNSPNGYANLLTSAFSADGVRVDADVIGSRSTHTSTVTALQMTVDVEPASLAEIARAGGTIVLAGNDQMFSASAQSSGRSHVHVSDRGSLWLALNFDDQTATIRIIHDDTGAQTQGLLSADFLGEHLPFNIETGLFGGDVTGEARFIVWADGTRTLAIDGTLLGAVGGWHAADLVAGGTYQLNGDIPSIGDLRIEGVFAAGN